MNLPIRSADVHLAVDVGDFGRVEMTARVVAPERVPEHVCTLVCVPGMSYGKEYFDLPFDGYSFARMAAATGQVVITVDNLGTQARARPADGDALTLAVMAAANAALVDELLRRLTTGNLIPSLTQLAITSTIGIGHSLGGCLVLLQQAAFQSFDAVAILGFSNQPLAGIYEPHEREAELSDAERLAWATEHLPPKLWGRRWEELEPYFELPRENFRELFYAPETAEEMIAADIAAATVVPRVAAIQTTIPGVSAAAAAEVSVPVFIAYGRVDLSPDPLAEVCTYPASPEITLLRLAASAHCHNLAPDRARLWKRLLEWAPGAATG